jgi:hypothetical protein
MGSNPTKEQTKNKTQAPRVINISQFQKQTTESNVALMERLDQFIRD